MVVVEVEVEVDRMTGVGSVAASNKRCGWGKARFLWCAQRAVWLGLERELAMGV